VLKLSRNPNAITSYGVDTTQFSMQDAFLSNFGTAIGSQYDWLKLPALSYSFAGVNTSVL